jgi:hypothetical protein
MRGYAGRTTSPKSARPGCRFLDHPPPIHEERETGTANDLLAEKKNDYFVFNLLIVNNINQYFNIRLHLIRFITYNRRIFIAKYLFDSKTCSIFAYVKKQHYYGAPEADTSPEGTGKSNDR